MATATVTANTKVYFGPFEPKNPSVTPYYYPIIETIVNSQTVTVLGADGSTPLYAPKFAFIEYTGSGGVLRRGYVTQDRFTAPVSSALMPGKSSIRNSIAASTVYPLPGTS